jgi:glutamine amidotransferase
MCRFLTYVGPSLTLDSLITRPIHSIVHQSFDSHERSEPLNGDGFGVAWYVPELSEEPGCFRSITPAWNNQNLVQIARLTRSGSVLAHVRAASPGLAVTETNCHPFVHGRFAFMHNGQVAGFARIKREILAQLSDRAYDTIKGSTDSEMLFAVFLDELWGGAEPDPLEATVHGVEAAFRRVLEAGSRRGVEEHSYLNVAVADGACAVVTRFTTAAPDKAPSLYLHEGRRYVCEAGVCRMVEPGDGHGAVIVASEPLSHDPGWHPVPANHAVLIRADGTAQLRTLNVAAAPAPQN